MSGVARNNKITRRSNSFRGQALEQNKSPRQVNFHYTHIPLFFLPRLFQNLSTIMVTKVLGGALLSTTPRQSPSTLKREQLFPEAAKRIMNYNDKSYRFHLTKPAVSFLSKVKSESCGDFSQVAAFNKYPTPIFVKTVKSARADNIKRGLEEGQARRSKVNDDLRDELNRMLNVGGQKKPNNVESNGRKKQWASVPTTARLSNFEPFTTRRTVTGRMVSVFLLSLSYVAIFGFVQVDSIDSRDNLAIGCS